MRNLLKFLLKYGTWFVLAFYVLLSCVLLVSNNSYQQSVYLTSANSVTGAIYGATANVTGYFNLRSINESLQKRNAALESEVLNLKNQIAEYQVDLDSTAKAPEAQKRFGFVSAGVINNNTRHPRNYFTINRGRRDGVARGMGVVDQDGIVGIVNVAGDHTSRVISLLNETQHFSVKVKGTLFVGSLSWRGGDPTVAYMDEVPRHAQFHAGDTIVTSGYSTAFPEGLPVGMIMNRVKSSDDNFFVLKIRLLPNFRGLQTVRVINDIYKQELDSLKTFDYKVDNEYKIENDQ